MIVFLFLESRVAGDGSPEADHGLNPGGGSDEGPLDEPLQHLAQRSDAQLQGARARPARYSHLRSTG